jgi:putative ABC transport system permease protein
MTVRADLTSAFRNLRRGRWLTAAIVLILGVAIGAVTAIFSIAHAVLIRPLPVTEPERVLLLWGRDDARSQQVVEVSVQDQRAWLAGQKSFDGIALFGSVNWGELHVAAPGQPFRAVQNGVSSGFFDVLGARPMLGRTFRPADDLRDARRTMVLSADVWREHFSSEPSVVGRLLTVGTGTNATSYEVIGVMPPAFHIPAGAEVWTALGPALAGADDVRAMYAVARLAPGATLASGVAELSTIARSEQLKNGMTNTSMVVVATPLMEHLLGPARPALLAIAGASAALLLIACANATALLLVHGAARRREIAVRLALGARRLQIVRHLLCESLVLSAVAGVLGAGLAYVSFDAILSLAPIDVPRLDEAAIDVRTLIFVGALCVATAVSIGLVPAWRHSGIAPGVGLQDRSRSATSLSASARARKLLVAAQLAIVVVLLTGAGLFVRSFTALLRLDLGFDPGGVLTFNVGFPEERYDTREEQRALIETLLDRAGRLPGAVAAGAVFQRPFAHGAIGMDADILIEGQTIGADSSSRNPIVNWEVATPDYFRTMGIGLVQGRFFDERDTAASPPVVIVGRSLGERLWPGQDPLGRRLLTYGAPGGETNPAWQTVVGVVEDARYREVETPRFDLYLSHRQAPNDVRDVVVRFAGDPADSVPALRAAVAALDPRIRLERLSTMDDVVAQAFAPWRFSSVIVSAFAVIALTFAVVGVATLVAFAVTMRTREIGVRVALGARSRDVIALVAREGAAIALTGLAVGLVAAWLLRRSVTSLLFGISPDDPVTFVAAPLLLGVIAVLAAYLPARRAALVDPALTLRAE